MKRKSWYFILVGLVTVVGCARNDEKKPGIVYDAAAVSRILGLPCEISDPVPQAKDGEIVVYYGGWNLKQLRNSVAGKELMLQVPESGERDKWKADPGYYRLLLPVPDSNMKTWNEQLRHLATIDAAWRAAPVCVAVTALLVHSTVTGNDLLKNDNWYLCAEMPTSGCHTVLAFFNGRVGVGIG